MRVHSTLIVTGILALSAACTATAQHDFHRTKTVDPSGNADFMTIHEAIDDITDVSEKWTVLVYAGTYTIDSTDELIELDDEHENVDIVGVDSEAVIIDVTIGDAQTPRPGIKIISGTENERNNVIRNLTIKTTHGHGIEIVKGGTPVPKNITIDGVTIRADGSDSHGIAGAAADTVHIRNCVITSDDDDAVEAGDDFSIDTCTLLAPTNTRTALTMTAKSGLEISSSLIGVADPNGDQPKRGILIDQGSDVAISGSIIEGDQEALRLDQPGDDVVFRSVIIRAEGAPTGAGSKVVGIFAEANDANTTTTPVFQSCRIEAIGGTATATTEEVKAVEIDQTDGIRFLECSFQAISRNDGVKKVYGIECLDKKVFITGGIIETNVEPDTLDADKVTEVFDLVSNDPSAQIVPQADRIFVAGTRFTRWIGAINALERQRAVQQRLLQVDDESTTAVHSGIDLTMSEQEVTTGITNPDAYRVVTVTGNQLGMNQPVILVGTNWADENISEKVTLNGTTPVEGKKPFKTVTKIIAPAETGSDQTITVGTSNRLGLYYAVAASGNVIEWSKLNQNNIYEVQSIGNLTIGNDGIRFGTVEPNSIGTDDDFQFDLLTIQ